MIKLTRWFASNNYILIATDYTIKWVEVEALKTNIIVVIAKNLYECILIRFGYPLTLVIDQGVHFINDVIKYLIDHFLLKHVSSTTYYPEGNGQAKSTNKFIVNLITNLVSENMVDWDKQFPIVFFSYKTTYKVTIGYTPYRYVYGLHFLMSTKYVLSAFNGDHIYVNHVKVLTNRIIKQEKLQTNKLHDEETIGSQQWNCDVWSQQKYAEKQFKFVDHVL